ncbi:MAG: ECF transporter S component [Clostridia bacterium]|jgi:energy-coupling factor transport system substrate-specific component|nr:ECF transporter S component [Clostridia bacterium]
MFVIKSAPLRRAVRAFVPFALIPALVALGALVLRQKNYALISLLIALLSFVLFAAGFEKKKTGSRRLVLVAVMVALSVAGRFIPVFKPVTALTILTGVYLGGEAGFLTGSLTAVLSNFYFGQGPWTSFQMMALGLIGLFAGFLSGPLKRSRIILVLYGALAGVAYSFIMDIWTVVWYGNGFDTALYLTSLVSAVPYTVSYVISNTVFLFIFAKPFGEKFTRVKLKYGV